MPFDLAHPSFASSRRPGTNNARSPRATYASARSRAYGIVVVVALHVVLLAGLWQMTPVKRAVLASVPVVVQLLQHEPPAPPPPPPKAPPRPRVETPAPRPPEVEVPAIATAPPVPAPQWVAPAPVPPPVVEVANTPPADATPVAEATAPRFDADYLRNPAPAYPAVARRNGEEGRVLLRVLVGANGEAQRVELKTSSGFERLDAAALETVRQWKFVPARLGGEAVAAWVVVPVTFALRR